MKKATDRQIEDYLKFVWTKMKEERQYWLNRYSGLSEWESNSKRELNKLEQSNVQYKAELAREQGEKMEQPEPLAETK